MSRCNIKPWSIGDIRNVGYDCDGALYAIDVLDKGENRVVEIITRVQLIAKDIIQCVNEHDSLVTRVQELEAVIQTMIDLTKFMDEAEYDHRLDELRSKNKQLEAKVAELEKLKNCADCAYFENEEVCQQCKVKNESAEYNHFEGSLTSMIFDELRSKNKQLLEVLRKCSPEHCIAVKNHISLEPKWEIVCKFCNYIGDEHAENCEYIGLTKEDAGDESGD